MSTPRAGGQGGPRIVYRAGPSILYTVLIGAVLVILGVSLAGGMLLALLVPDLLQPARPARAAIDTHRRWLHGAL